MPVHDVTPNSVAANLFQPHVTYAAITDGPAGSWNAKRWKPARTTRWPTRRSPPKELMDVRKHQATVDTHNERLSARTAEALVRGRRSADRELEGAH